MVDAKIQGDNKYSPLDGILRISDNMSPLAETVEISEGVLVGGGTLATEDVSVSDTSCISDLRNSKNTISLLILLVSQFINPDNSITYSVIDVDYKYTTASFDAKYKSHTDKALRPIEIMRPALV